MANRTPTCLALALCVSLVFADDKTMMELTKQAIKLESKPHSRENRPVYPCDQRKWQLLAALPQSRSFYLNHGLWEPAINDASECIRLNPGLAVAMQFVLAGLQARDFSLKLIAICVSHSTSQPKTPNESISSMNVAAFTSHNVTITRHC